MAEREEDFLSWTFSDVDFDQPAMNAARARRFESKERRHEILEKFIDVICEDETMQPYLNINFLMRFLRCGKFKLDRAHKRLRKYYYVISKYPEIFRDFLPSCTLRAQSLNHISVLPYRARDNSVIVLHKLGQLDPTIATFEELVRLDRLVLESLLQNPVTQLRGVTLLINFEGFSILQSAQFTPSRIQAIFDLYHGSNGLLVTNIHIVNAFGLANTFFDLLRSRIMSQKMKDRVFSHPYGDWKSLHSHLPPEILPEEFSGHLKSTDLVYVYDLVNYNEDYFLEQHHLTLF